MELQCAYCDHWADFPTELESRNGKIVCKDIAACDARDAAANSNEDDD